MGSGGGKFVVSEFDLVYRLTFFSLTKREGCLEAHKMQTRYMERSNSLAREKRALDPSSTEEGQSDRKRPALARYLFVSTVFLSSFE